ncbi:MAG: hypothetical protein NUW01_11715 [Gemmatimonadaceae bacterium]|nr:hypothetical protein [Gemmatimonadaceae bacterium]
MRLIRAKVLAGEVTEEEATGMLGKSPFEAQGKIPAMRWPTPTVADTFTDKLASSQQTEGSMHSVNLSQAVQMWPTPRAVEWKANEYQSKNGRSWPTLTGAVRGWATPTAHPRTHSPRKVDHGEQLANQVGGQLNPTWVELLMGYPPGWTDLD